MSTRDKSLSYGEGWIRENMVRAPEEVRSWRRGEESDDPPNVRVYDSSQNCMRTMPLSEMLPFLAVGETLQPTKNEQVRVTEDTYVSSNIYDFVAALLVASRR
jgi:hypothetical protein